jgi:tripeptide aminopeptidase
MLEYFGGFAIEKNDPLVQTVDQAMRKSGIKPVYKVYNAVTNANLLNQVGIKSVLLSTGVENQHTVEERISITSLNQVSEILLKTISI